MRRFASVLRASMALSPLHDPMSRFLPGLGPVFVCLVLVVGCLALFGVSAWPVTLLQVAQDDLCILCTHGVSIRAKKHYNFLFSFFENHFINFQARYICLLFYAQYADRHERKVLFQN